MYRSVLVPLDGSTFGEQALPLAQSIARRAGASLQIVRVHVSLMPYDESALTVDPRLDDIARARSGTVSCGRTRRKGIGSRRTSSSPLRVQRVELLLQPLLRGLAGVHRAPDRLRCRRRDRSVPFHASPPFPLSRKNRKPLQCEPVAALATALSEAYDSPAYSNPSASTFT